jgi:bifunctional DNA-binding transcriptional regulator/antitoxin component of YhaV-PrlF toxin-antitoxin module
MNAKNTLIAVSKVSDYGTSLRMSLPKEIAEKLNIDGKAHLGFYEENGKIWIRKVE